MIKKILMVIFKLIVPLEKFISIFKKPECKTTTAQYLDLLSKIQDNDVLFSKTNWEVSNLGIPGPYKHIAVYRAGLVYEAVTEGVRAVSLAEWFFKKDNVGVGRYSMVLTADQLSSGLGFLQSQVGDPYQYDFAVFGRKSYFCSAYWYAYMESMVTNFSSLFPKNLMFGLVPSLSPSDCWKKMVTVIEYKN